MALVTAMDRPDLPRASVVVVVFVFCDGGCCDVFVRREKNRRVCSSKMYYPKSIKTREPGAWKRRDDRGPTAVGKINHHHSISSSLSHLLPTFPAPPSATPKRTTSRNRRSISFG